MGGKFNTREPIDKKRAAKLEAKGRQLLKQGRAMLDEAARMRGQPHLHNPSVAMLRALSNGNVHISSTGLKKSLERQLNKHNWNISAVALALDTHRIQVRRWARSLGISLPGNRS